MSAARGAYFIRCSNSVCAIVRLHADGREEILEQGLTRADAETLYFICIGEPLQYEGSAPVDAEETPAHRRPRQLSFKF